MSPPMIRSTSGDLPSTDIILRFITRRSALVSEMVSTSASVLATGAAGDSGDGARTGSVARFSSTITSSTVMDSTTAGEAIFEGERPGFTIRFIGSKSPTGLPR